MSNLKTIRTEKQLSQSQLAMKADVSIDMIQKYEQGKRDINKAQAFTLYKIAKALHCKIEDLLEIDYNRFDLIGRSCATCGHSINKTATFIYCKFYYCTRGPMQYCDDWTPKK